MLVPALPPVVLRPLVLRLLDEQLVTNFSFEGFLSKIPFPGLPEAVLGVVGMKVQVWLRNPVVGITIQPATDHRYALVQYALIVIPLS